MNIPVVVFSDHSGRFIAGIEAQRGSVTVARHAQDMSEVFGLGQTGIARAVLLVADYEEFLTQSLVAQLHEMGVAVVAVTDPGVDVGKTGAVGVDALADIETVIARLEYAVELVEAGETVTHLSETTAPPNGTSAKAAAEAQESPEIETTGKSQGKIIAVWGPAGAPGRTSVAVNLAATLAAQGYTTALVDADTYGPAIGTVLGLIDDYSGISQLCHYADRSLLTEEKYREHISTIDIAGKTLDIVSGITRADRWPEVREKPLTSVLNFMAEQYQAVVVDTGFSLEADEEITFDGLAPQRNAATITALEHATDIVVTGAADVVGFPRLVRAMEELKHSHIQLQSNTTVHVWMNKVRTEAGNGKSTAELERAWTRFGPPEEISGYIPLNTAIYDQAMLSGKTLIEMKEAEKSAKVYEKMVKQVMLAESAAHTNAVTVPRYSVLATLRHRFLPRTQKRIS